MAPALPPTQENPLFHYHANGYGFSAHFTRPFEYQIDVQAASSLCVVGGHSCARVEDFRFREFIKFDAAYTHLSGGLQADDRSNNTLVTSVIEGLNMFDVLTADRVVCRLYSKHPHRAPEGRITMHGSKFENLQICGHPVTMNLDFQLFEDIQTYEQAQNAYRDTSSPFYAAASDPFHTGHPLPQQDLNGAFLCSLATGGIRIGSANPVPGHSLYVPGFGTVYFAEVFLTHGQRNLTMLRFQLGSSTGGSGSGASGSSNGKHYPPSG
jgi:hypothetical protein